MMKIFGKKAKTLLAVFALAVAVSGCGSSEDSAAKDDTLVFGVTNFADSMETTQNYFGWEVMRRGAGECLTSFDEKMNVVPCVAESWKVSDDKLSWTFKIRDIKFSNGNPVTGEAVKNP